MASNRINIFSIAVKVKAKTELAILVVSEDGDEAWVPFSKILDGSEIDEDGDVGDEGKLLIPEWLAEDRGWA